ncbi:hypothetical protein DYB32_001974 [Aphanomyces invadans]|uniref:CHY-type domain-containing protein n=1 Tax=Aphanomyces invadans TaxID=157072 RepID=A0A3R6Z8F8_9STRA|nr:hypothetical protein DYB32_001974 [Aphanomyces invadans]
MSWQEKLATITSCEERELFAVLRRYGACREFTPVDVQIPCTLVLRLVPSDPEFPFQLDKGLIIHVQVPLQYPHVPAVFTVECDTVPGFQAKFADTIANQLHARQALFPGQLVLRKTLTWLDNNLKQIMLPPRNLHTPVPASEVNTIVALSSPSDATATIAPSNPEALPENRRTDVNPSVAPVTVSSGKANIPRLCRFYAAGKCAQGATCRYSHTLPVKLRTPKDTRKAASNAPDADASLAAPSAEAATPKTKKGKRGARNESKKAALSDASVEDGSRICSSEPSPCKAGHTEFNLNGSSLAAAGHGEGEHQAKSFSRRADQVAKTAASSVQPSTSQPPPKPITTNPSRQRTPSANKPMSGRVCRFYRQGQCNQGDACRFVHPGGDVVAVPTLASRSAEPADIEQGFAVIDTADVAGKPLTEHTEATTTTAASTDGGHACEVNSCDDDLAPPVPTQSHVARSTTPWTVEQQAQLDAALKRFPPGSFDDAKARWHAIAECVDGRSMKDCIGRFKVLADYVRSTASTASASLPSTKATTSCLKKVPKVGLAAARLLRDPTSTVAIVKAAPPQANPTHTDVGQNHPKSAPAVVPDDADNDDTSDSTDSRILPASTRVKLDLEIDPKAIHVQLNALFLHHIDKLQLHAWKCAFQCAQCPLSFDSTLSLSKNTIRQWCRRCSVLQTVELRPVLMHTANELAVNVHLINCTLVDVMPPIVCRRCHAKMAVECKAFTIVNQSVDRFVDHSQPKAKKKLTKDDAMVVGQPLPNQGRCSHYSKSLRWFRFQCCGKAYPCDVCHAASACPDAGNGTSHARCRFICGLCSREHSSQQKECPCGNVVGNPNTSSHWEGGKGCRDPVRMSSADPKKFSGVAKTKSMKFKRVGAEAKKRREQRKQQVN